MTKIKEKMTVRTNKLIRIILRVGLIILLVTGAVMISFIYLENRVNNHIDTGAWFIADNVSEISFTHNGLLFGVIQIVHQTSVLVVGIILARNFNKYIIMKQRLKLRKLQIVEKFGRDLYEIDEVLISVYREDDKWYIDVFNNYQDFSYFKREITRGDFVEIMQSQSKIHSVEFHSAKITTTCPECDSETLVHDCFSAQPIKFSTEKLNNRVIPCGHCKQELITKMKVSKFEGKIHYITQSSDF